MIAKFSYNMTKKQKKMALRIFLSATALVPLRFLPLEGLARLGLYLIPYLIAGYDILLAAARGIRNRQVLDENFLMAIATVGALALGVLDTGDYNEAVLVMVLYQTGELFQSYAVGKSRKSISALMDIRPDYANMEQDGQLVQVDPEEVEIGSIITVLPGEKIPIDGEVTEGCSTLDTASLTGESLPRDVAPGDPVISGCINLSGLLKVRTTREFSDSTVSKILELVENASFNKAGSEKFITKFARIYTPAVCAAALALAVLPPLVRLALGVEAGWSMWLYRGLTFLVASCPCALVISIPLTFFAGIGGASRAGILVKGSNYLEALAQVKTLVFDKTGTLTQGAFHVSSIQAVDGDREALLEMAAHAESGSNHPVSRCIREAYGKQTDGQRVTRLQEHFGKGITACVDAVTVTAGNEKLMMQENVDFVPCDGVGTAVYVAIDGKFAGSILIADQLKRTSAEAIRQLKKIGITDCVMLTGDNAGAAAAIAQQLGISRYHAQLLPEQKVEIVEHLLETAKGKLAFVGDGINDAPVLSRADIGIAMGAMGSDAAIEAADVVLMRDDPMQIVKAIGISRLCRSIVYQNIVFSIVIKLLSLVLVAAGMAGMGLAIFADVGVMVLAVLNATRALIKKG
jgi:Cd2+/Zn2+-exporting ATPase